MSLWIPLGLHPRLGVLLWVCECVRRNDGGPGERRSAHAAPGGMSANGLNLLCAYVCLCVRARSVAQLNLSLS